MAILVAAGLACNLPSATAGPPPVSKRSELRWQAHAVAQIPNGYQVAVADVNGDGRLDIVTIGASTGNVVLYENLP